MRLIVRVGLDSYYYYGCEVFDMVDWETETVAFILVFLIYIFFQILSLILIYFRFFKILIFINFLY